MLRNLSDGLISIWEWFHEEILVIVDQGHFHVFVGVNGLPVCKDKVRDFIRMSSMDESSVEEFGVAFPFLEPLDARFLFP